MSQQQHSQVSWLPSDMEQGTIDMANHRAHLWFAVREH